jgi:hypothetical protein
MSLLFVILSLALNYFSPAELFPSLANYHLQQFVLAPALIGTLVLLSQRLKFLWPQDFLMIGFWFAVVMTRLTSGWFGGALASFFAFSAIVLVYFLVSWNSYSLSRIRIICGAVSACGVIMASQGLLAYHTGRNADKLIVRDRVVGWGILNDPNDLSQFLIVCLALLGVWWNKRSPLRSALLAVPAVILLYTIYLTLSRGAALGFVAVLFVLLSTRISKFISGVAVTFVFLVMLAVGFGGGRDYSLKEGSAAGRVMAWGTGIGMLKSHPVFGVGFGIFTDYNELTAHNSFVLCFAELGLFGYFFWLGLILTTVTGMERMIRLPVKAPAEEDFRRIAQSLRAALYGFLVTSWFLSRTYTITLYVLLALCGSIIYLREGGRLAVVNTMLNRRWVRLTVACQLASLVIVYVSVRLRSI